MQLKFKMKKINETKSPMLSRIELELEVAHNERKTPSRAELVAEIAKEFKKEKNTIYVDHIYTSYGKGKSKIIAYIYDSKEALEKIGKAKAIEEPVEEAKPEVKEEVKTETQDGEKSSEE
jgi:ribosomal protein S24E